MTINKVSLLTIITETALEHQLLELLDKLHAPGYTITNARGKGHRGQRSGSWGADSNIRVEVVCDHERALTIMHALEEKYYDNFAMVCFISEVPVLRKDKFLSQIDLD